MHDPRVDEDEAEREAAVDRDLDMLLEPQDEDEDEEETNADISIALQAGNNNNVGMHESHDLGIVRNSVNSMNNDSGVGSRDADGLTVDDVMGGQMHLHRTVHNNTHDNSGHLDGGNASGGLNSGHGNSVDNNNNNSANSANSANSLRPAMDLEPDQDPVGAGINRFISKMDIGRLLSSEEAARDSVMGVGDGGMDDGSRRAAEDERLDEMQFGGATG